MKTFDVSLPADRQIVFPSRCVVCEQPDPQGYIKLSFLGAQSDSLTEFAVDSALGIDADPKYYGGNTLNKVEGIPACKGCASKLKWYHRLLKFGYYTGWLPGVLLIFAGFPTWVCVLITILGAISPGIFTILYPPSFGMSFYNGKANFEFRSAAIAKEFSTLNSDAGLERGSNIENVAAQ